VVCDIYGYEVTIDSGELLDCCPSYYRLSETTGTLLYKAILSCIPGSVPYVEKIKGSLS